MKLYRFLHKLLAKFIRFFFNIKVIGKENEPKEGAVIVCANHLSFFDVVILGAALNRPLRFLAKKEVFKIPILSGLIKALGAFPVDRSSVASSANSVKTSLHLLSLGESVMLFPQGHRQAGHAPDEPEIQIKHGVGMMIKRSKAPVLPICIQSRKWTIRMFKRIYVSIGEPIYYEEFDFTEGGTEEYSEASEKVFSHICSLIIKDKDVRSKKKKKASKKNKKRKKRGKASK